MPCPIPPGLGATGRHFGDTAQRRSGRAYWDSRQPPVCNLIRSFVPRHFRSERYPMGLEPVQARVRNARRRHFGAAIEPRLWAVSAEQDGPTRVIHSVCELGEHADCGRALGKRSCSSTVRSCSSPTRDWSCSPNSPSAPFSASKWMLRVMPADNSRRSPFRTPSPSATVTEARSARRRRDGRAPPPLEPHRDAPL